MKLFGYGILAGLILVIGGLAATFSVMPLIAPERAPTPAITRVVNLDEKLRFIREHPEIDPTILAVGSSVTWRQLDGKAFEEMAGGPRRFLNGAVGLLKIHQTRALARFYLDRYRNVRTLLVLVGPADFEDCTEEPTLLFDPRDAARYAFGNWPTLYFHLRYFAPGRYAKGLTSRKERRTPLTGDIYNDRYGSGPVKLPDGVDLGLRYKAMDADPACVDELIGLAHDMDDRDVRLALVFAPVHPLYRQRYPDVIDRHAGFAARLAREERQIGRNLAVIDLISTPEFDANDFYDALHLEWPAVKRLSARIVREIAKKPPLTNERGLISRNVATP